MKREIVAPETLQEAILFFADYANCHKTVLAMRWPDGKVACPKCGSEHVTYLATQKRWKCYAKHAKPQFSLKVGTIFEDSPLPLQKWLPALWLVTNSKNGISSYELARALGVTQKTAWFMNHRIRLAMQNNDGGTLDGEVEVDETYIGGKARNMNKAQRQRALNGAGFKNAWAGKVPVMGLLQRHPEKGKSRIRTKPIDSIKTYRLHQEVSQNVEDGSTVYTDALASYNKLDLYYEHKVIDHAEKYVDGVIHTNGLENYWSLLKRTLRGTYVAVEPFHLFRYLDEQAFRFNERSHTDAERFAQTLKAVTGKRITFDALTGKQPAA